MFKIPVLTFKLLVIFSITAMRQLIHNRTTQRSTWYQSYDFIVVGAGTAGSIVAERLSENANVSVLLLEAGGPQDAIYNDIPPMFQYMSTERPDQIWTYYNEPEPNAGHSYPGGRMRMTVGRVIGGTSSYGGMMYFRGNRRDFDNWALNYGAQGWRYKDVLPYFLRYENNTDIKIVLNNPGYHSTTGPLQISTPRNPDPILLILKNTFNKLGFMDTDVNGAKQSGTMIGQAFIDQNGFRSQSGNGYIDPNPHPNNLHIVTNAMVLRILFNGTTAIGVEFDRNDTSNRVYARKEVILCAGNFRSPQILMLSGVGPRVSLENYQIPVLLDLPVGENYLCQPMIEMSFSINQIQNLTNSAPVLNIENLSQLYFNRTGPLSQWPTLMLFYSTQFNRDNEWPNAVFTPFINPGLLVFHSALVRHFSRGTAGLQSNSPYIPLKFESNILSDSRDFDNMVDAMRLVFYIMERTGIKQLVTPPTTIIQNMGCPLCVGRYIYDCDQAISCLIRMTAGVETTGGTCRMGSIERDDVVVDPNLRVKHAQNLRVCDSSIMPELPNSNTLAAVLMIGEKCAQIIRDCYN